MICGVYHIRNKMNGKSYVGSSCRVPTRLRHHLTGHGSLVVRRAVEKYGIAAFETAILEECDRRSLAIAEAKWISWLKPAYNLDALTESGGRIASAQQHVRNSPPQRKACRGFSKGKSIPKRLAHECRRQRQVGHYRWLTSKALQKGTPGNAFRKRQSGKLHRPIMVFLFQRKPERRFEQTRCNIGRIVSGAR